MSTAKPSETTPPAPLPKLQKRRGLLGWLYLGMLPGDRGKFWWSMVPGGAEFERSRTLLAWVPPL